MHRLVVLAGVVFGACSRAPSPTGASTGPLPAVLSVVAARDGSPVAGAVVQAAGQSGTTDAAGAAVVPVGKVSILGPAGFVSPSTLSVSGGTLHALWPDDTRMPSPWLSSAVFSAEGIMRRPLAGTMSIQYSEEALDDRWAGPAAAWATDALNRSQSKVVFRTGGPDAAVRVYRDPDDPAFTDPELAHVWAVTYLVCRGATVVGGRVVFRFWTDPDNGATYDRLRYAIAHELGHVMGLGHPEGGIMGSGTATDFSEREKEAMALMFLRPPGTRPPDDSSGSMAAASSRVREVLVCAR